jgi:hypothetical protein
VSEGSAEECGYGGAAAHLFLEAFEEEFGRPLVVRKTPAAKARRYGTSSGPPWDRGSSCWASRGSPKLVCSSPDASTLQVDPADDVEGLLGDVVTYFDQEASCAGLSSARFSVIDLHRMMQTCALTDGFVRTGIIASTYGQLSVNATRCRRVRSRSRSAALSRSKVPSMRHFLASNLLCNEFRSALRVRSSAL